MFGITYSEVIPWVRHCVFMLCCLSPPFASNGIGGQLDQLSSQSTHGLRKIFHQQYKNSTPETWPWGWKAFSTSWREHHPEWEFRFSVDADNRRLFQQHLPEYLDDYDSLSCTNKGFIMQADLSTYASLFAHGGIYADMDTAALRPLDMFLAELPETVDIVAVAFPEKPLVSEQEKAQILHYADTDIMLTRWPHSSFWSECIKSAAIFIRRMREDICRLEAIEEGEELQFLATALYRIQLCVHAWTAQRMNHSKIRRMEDDFMHVLRSGGGVDQWWKDALRRPSFETKIKDADIYLFDSDVALVAQPVDPDIWITSLEKTCPEHSYSWTQRRDYEDCISSEFLPRATKNQINRGLYSVKFGMASWRDESEMGCGAIRNHSEL